jgi:peptidoglycan pentaglycine glycine transferase (the first glycine)
MPLPISQDTLTAPHPYVLRPVTSRETWNSFVAGHPRGHLLQCWEWGELKATSGWSPVRLALFDEEHIVAAAQVLRRSAPHVPLLAGHLAYVPKGPVLDWSDDALYDLFMSALNRYLKQHGALTLHMEVGIETAEVGSELVRERLASLQSARAIQPLRTIILDLAPDEATLLAQMKEKWRYNVRLATRKGVTVRVAETEKDVRAWYTLLQTTSTRDTFGIHTLDYYLYAWRLLAANEQACLLLAEHEGQLLAGIFVSLFARQAIYLYGASSNEQRHLMPNYILQWEAIRWAKHCGATNYDFWGIPESDAEDEAMAGVYRFKRGWGGRVVQFPGCYQYVYRPLTMKLAERFLPL